MGFFKLTLIGTLLVGITAVLLQIYAPDTLDQVLMNPSVQRFTVKADTFIQDSRVHIYEVGYPIYLKVEQTLRSVTTYIKYKMTASPFVEETNKSSKKQKSVKTERILTEEQLKKYDGKAGSKGLYLALMGQIFNVKKGKQHYGPGGGYEFFAGEIQSHSVSITVKISLYMYDKH